MHSVKKIFFLLLSAAVLLAGCNAEESGGKAADLKLADVAASIFEKVEFKNTLALAEGEVLENRYVVSDKVTGHAVYYDAGGGSAEEIAVFRVDDAQNIQELEDMLDQRLKTLAFNFENYRPDELQKINNPVIVKKGRIIVMVLTDDRANAEEVIKSLIG